MVSGWMGGLEGRGRGTGDAKYASARDCGHRGAADEWRRYAKDGATEEEALSLPRPSV